MAYSRQGDRDRLFQYSENAGNSFSRKETALDMDGAHHDRLGRANASKSQNYMYSFSH